MDISPSRVAATATLRCLQLMQDPTSTTPHATSLGRRLVQIKGSVPAVVCLTVLVLDDLIGRVAVTVYFQNSPLPHVLIVDKQGHEGLTRCLGHFPLVRLLFEGIIGFMVDIAKYPPDKSDITTKQRSPQGRNSLVRWLFILVFVGVLLRTITEGGDRIVATDEQGSTWQMTSVRDAPLRTLLNRKVKPGPPLTVGASVRRQGSVMLMDLVIKGQAGETYRPSVTQDGRRVRTSAPSFTVVGRSGRVHGSGKFQFG